MERPTSLKEWCDAYTRFKPFAPRYLRHRLKSKVLTNKNLLEPESVPVYASLLFADISGFTRLSSKLSADELQKHINDYFTQLLNIIHVNHGDVVKFCGDAVLIMWPVPVSASPEMKKASTLMASLCALQLLEECGEYRRPRNTIRRSKTSALSPSSSQDGDVDMVELSLHCGISCGEIHCMTLGAGGRFEFLLSGRPVSEMGLAEGAASRGEVCLNQSAYRAVMDELEAVPVFEPSTSVGNPTLIPAMAAPTAFRLTGRVRRPGGLSNDSHLASCDELENSVESKIGDDSDLTEQGSDLSFLDRSTSTRDQRTSAWIQTQPSMERNTLSGEHESGLAETSDTKFPAPGQDWKAVTTREHANLSRQTTQLNGFSGWTKDATKSFFSFLGDIPVVSSADNSAAEIIPSSKPTQQSGGSRKMHVSPLFGRRKFVRKLKRKLKVNKTPGVVALREFYDSWGDGPFEGQEEALVRDLRKMVHETALSAIETQTASLLSEMRDVAVVFVQIKRLEADFREGLWERPQQAFTTLSSLLHTFGGSLRQFVVDDKGCVAIACFGLFGSSNRNNCCQATEFALAYRTALSLLGCSGFAGVTLGKVYCGLVGTSDGGVADRCEFAVMGSSVNLAARLMCAAEKRCAGLQSPERGSEGVLVDSAVWEQAQKEFSFTEFESIVCKGYEEPVRIFIPLVAENGSPLVSKTSPGANVVTTLTRRNSVHFSAEETEILFDREKEMGKAMGILFPSPHDPTPSVPRCLLVAGIAGSGKSAFLRQLKGAISWRHPGELFTASVSLQRIDSCIPFSLVSKLMQIVFTPSQSLQAHADSSETLRLPPPLALSPGIRRNGMTRRSMALRQSVQMERVEEESCVTSSSFCSTYHSVASLIAASNLSNSSPLLFSHKKSALVQRRDSLKAPTEPLFRTSSSISCCSIEDAGASVAEELLLFSEKARLGYWSIDCADTMEERVLVFLRRFGLDRLTVFDLVENLSSADLQFSVEETSMLKSTSTVELLPLLNPLLSASFQSHEFNSNALSPVARQTCVELLFEAVLANALGIHRANFSRETSDPSAAGEDPRGCWSFVVDDLQHVDDASLRIWIRLLTRVRFSVCREVASSVLARGCMVGAIVSTSEVLPVNLRTSSLHEGSNPLFLMTADPLQSLLPLCSVMSIPRLSKLAVRSLVMHGVGKWKWSWLLQNIRLALGESLSSPSSPVATTESAVPSSLQIDKGSVPKRRNGVSAAGRGEWKRSEGVGGHRVLESREQQVAVINATMLTRSQSSGKRHYRSSVTVAVHEDSLTELIYTLTQKGLPSSVMEISNSIRDSIDEGTFVGLHKLPAVIRRTKLLLEVLDQLSGEEVAVVKAASVVGPIFERHLLATTLKGMSLHHCAREKTLDKALHRLVEVGLVQYCSLSSEETKSAGTLSQTEVDLLFESKRKFCFVEDSTQLAVYNLMLESQRSLAHHVIAASLERRLLLRVADPGNLFLITKHYVRSTCLDKKIRYLHLSAEAAKANGDFGDALVYLCDLLLVTVGFTEAELLGQCKEFEILFLQRLAGQGTVAGDKDKPFPTGGDFWAKLFPWVIPSQLRTDSSSQLVSASLKLKSPSRSQAISLSKQLTNSLRMNKVANIDIDLPPVERPSFKSSKILLKPSEMLEQASSSWDDAEDDNTSAHSSPPLDLKELLEDWSFAAVFQKRTVCTNMFGALEDPPSPWPVSVLNAAKNTGVKLSDVSSWVELIASINHRCGNWQAAADFFSLSVAFKEYAYLESPATFKPLLKRSGRRLSHLSKDSISLHRDRQDAKKLTTARRPHRRPPQHTTKVEVDSCCLPFPLFDRSRAVERGTGVVILSQDSLHSISYNSSFGSVFSGSSDSSLFNRRYNERPSRESKQDNITTIALPPQKQQSSLFLLQDWFRRGSLKARNSGSYQVGKSKTQATNIPSSNTSPVTGAFPTAYPRGTSIIVNSARSVSVSSRHSTLSLNHVDRVELMTEAPSNVKTTKNLFPSPLFTAIGRGNSSHSPGVVLYPAATLRARLLDLTSNLSREFAAFHCFCKGNVLSALLLLEDALGQYEEARAATRRTKSLVSSQDSASHTGPLKGVIRTKSWLSVVYRVLGRVDAAMACLREAMEECKELDDGTVTCSLMAAQAMHAAFSGRVAISLALMEHVGRLYRKENESASMLWVNQHCVWLMQLQGDLKSSEIACGVQESLTEEINWLSESKTLIKAQEEEFRNPCFHSSTDLFVNNSDSGKIYPAGDGRLSLFGAGFHSIDVTSSWRERPTHYNSNITFSTGETPPMDTPTAAGVRTALRKGDRLGQGTTLLSQLFTSCEPSSEGVHPKDEDPLLSGERGPEDPDAFEPELTPTFQDYFKIRKRSVHFFKIVCQWKFYDCGLGRASETEFEGTSEHLTAELRQITDVLEGWVGANPVRSPRTEAEDILSRHLHEVFDSGGSGDKRKEFSVSSFIAQPEQTFIVSVAEGVHNFMGIFAGLSLLQRYRQQFSRVLHSVRSHLSTATDPHDLAFGEVFLETLVLVAHQMKGFVDLASNNLTGLFPLVVVLRAKYEYLVFTLVHSSLAVSNTLAVFMETLQTEVFGSFALRQYPPSAYLQTPVARVDSTSPLDRLRRMTTALIPGTIAGASVSDGSVPLNCSSSSSDGQQGEEKMLKVWKRKVLRTLLLELRDGLNRLGELGGEKRRFASVARKEYDSLLGDIEEDFNSRTSFNSGQNISLSVDRLAFVEFIVQQQKNELQTIIEDIIV